MPMGMSGSPFMQRMTVNLSGACGFGAPPTPPSLRPDQRKLQLHQQQWSASPHSHDQIHSDFGDPLFSSLNPSPLPEKPILPRTMAASHQQQSSLGSHARAPPGGGQPEAKRQRLMTEAKTVQVPNPFLAPVSTLPHHQLKAQQSPQQLPPPPLSAVVTPPSSDMASLHSHGSNHSHPSRFDNHRRTSSCDDTRASHAAATAAQAFAQMLSNDGTSSSDMQAFLQTPPTTTLTNNHKTAPAKVDKKNRRRERNRLLAQKTREKKKSHFENLQKQVLELQQENSKLKDLVATNVEDSESILQDCSAADQLHPMVQEAMESFKSETLGKEDFDLVKSIQGSQQSFVITDPSLQNNPIVFASGDFLKLTGYTNDQVIGQNCRFLQGPGTDPQKIETMRSAMARGEDVTVTLVNYMADGTPFWNKLFIASLRDIDNNIVNYIAVSCKVAKPAPDDPEFGKELPYKASA